MMISVPQVCLGINELSLRWKTSRGELLQMAASGYLAVGVRDFSEAFRQPPPSGVERPDFDKEPDQFKHVGVLTLDSADLAKVASGTLVDVQVAYVNWLDGKHGVLLDRLGLTGVNDLVVPMDEVLECESRSEAPPTMKELSSRREDTLHKIIGALALVITKIRGPAGNWGIGPNKKALAVLVDEAIDTYAAELGQQLNTSGVKPTNVRAAITLGLALLTDKAK